jgi:hypothetical protein
VDPDNEVEQYWSTYNTRNYVKFQPAAQTGSVAAAGTRYASTRYPNAALVAARGVTKADFYLAVAAVSGRARVSHSSIYFNPDDIFADEKWVGFGGSDTNNADNSGARMNSADENLNIVFKYPTLAPGEVAQFAFAYVLATPHEEAALLSLSTLHVLQPVYGGGGGGLLVSVRCAAAMAELTVAVFGVWADAVPASSSSAWRTVATVSCAQGGYADASFDASLLRDGSAQLEVRGRPLDPALPAVAASGALLVCNAAPRMAFAAALDAAGAAGEAAQHAFYTSPTAVLTLLPVTSGAPLPLTVSFFRDVFLDGEVRTELIGSDAEAPFTVAVSVGDLEPGTRMFLRAEATFAAAVAGCFSTTTLPGLVVRANRPPTDLLLSAARVAENAAPGTVIGTLRAVDSDAAAGAVVLYTLLDDAAGALRIEGDALVVRGPIDFEAAASLLCRVRADDGAADRDTCCLDKAFTIAVQDVNEPPKAVSPLLFSVREDASVGALLGAFSAVDADAGQTVSYSLLSAMPALGVSGGGELRTAGGLDFETAPELVFVLRAVDSGYPAQLLDSTVTVRVLDVNEAPTGLRLTCAAPALPAALCSIAENAAVGTVVGTFAAIDQDAADIAAGLRYSLTGSAGGRLAVDPVSGELRVAGGIDYESLGDLISVSARATDGGGLWTALSADITVTNVAEPPYAADVVCYVREGRRVGESVTAAAGGSSPCGMAAGLLLSEGKGQGVNFRIIDDNNNNSSSNSSNSSSSQSDIVIESCSGLFFVSGELDYESRTSYNLSIAVEDAGGVYLARALILVADVNEAPLLPPPAPAAVDENSPAGFLVGAPLGHTVLDPDCLEAPWLPMPRLHCGPLTFSVEGGGGKGAGFFNFSDAIPGQLLVSAPGLNFEVAGAYLLRVAVSDAGGLSAATLLSVNVSDVNERPTLTAGGSGVFAALPEHAPAGTRAGIPIYAADEDVGQLLSVQIVEGNALDAFSLVEEAGNLAPGAGSGRQFYLEVKNSSALDFELRPRYTLVLQVTDSGAPPLSQRQSYTIALTDVNEAPSLASPLALAAREDAAGGSLVGSLRGFWADPDAGDAPAFSISSYGGDAMQRFAIDSASGDVTLRAPKLSFRAAPSYSYEVTVTDRGGLTAVSALSIAVLDVKEAPVFREFPGVEMAENVPALARAPLSISEQPYVFRATDDDLDPLTFAVAAVDGDAGRAHLFGVRALSADSVLVFSNSSLNYERQAVYALNLSVSDGYFTAYSAVRVSVLDKNDPPTAPAAVTCFVAADAQAGTSVCVIFGEDEDSASGSLWGQLNYSFTAPVPGFRVVTAAGSNIGRIEYAGAGAGGPSTEANTSCTVVVTDGGGLTAATQVLIVTVPANRPPQCPALPLTLTLLENAAPGTAVGRVLGADPAVHITDDGSALVVSIAAGNVGGAFRVDPSTGVIYVAAGARVDFETRPRYELTLLAAEQAAHPLSAACAVLVQLLDENEPTTFPDQAFSADETSEPGPLLAGGLSAGARLAVRDEDPADQHGTFALTCVSPSCGGEGGPIEVNGTTGQLALKEGRALNFESQAMYVYNCSWLSRGVAASAVVTVRVLDVAETPLVLPSAFAVNETSLLAGAGAGGTLVGAIFASDPDYEGVTGPGGACRDACGLVYSIESAAPSTGQFSVDAATGVISAAALDFERDAYYELVVRVVDAAGLRSTGAVTVSVGDLPDCAVTSLVGPDGLELRAASTAGGGQLTVYGADLGPGRARMLREGIPAPAVTAWLQSAASQAASSLVFAMPCHMNYSGLNDNTMLSCTLPPGVGRGLGVTVAIATEYGGGPASVCRSPLSLGVMSYAPPTISAVTGAAALATNGTSFVQVFGDNFGRALNSFVELTASNEYSSRTLVCVVTADYVALRCPVGAGRGGGLQWAVTVGAQRSAAFSAGSFAAPYISGVGGAPLDTGGGSLFSVQGGNFGASADAVEVWYGAETAWSTKPLPAPSWPPTRLCCARPSRARARTSGSWWPSRGCSAACSPAAAAPSPCATRPPCWRA